ncbi:MAG: NAD(P)-dependent oxidoreductase [Pseudomonadota bacterium]
MTKYKRASSAGPSRVPEFGSRPIQIGVIGTGFVARHFVLELLRRSEWQLGRVLTRRPLDSVEGFPEDALTDSPEELIESADIVFECTGDVTYATRQIGAAMAAGRPVVTLNPEFHVTTGSALVAQGYLTEAEGDQPGVIASLYGEAVALGFEPVVLGNIKGFLNLTPTLSDMKYWAERQGISLQMVTSFTDGTKLQVEQCLVGNFFGANIAREGLLGPENDDIQATGDLLGEAAGSAGELITDYVLSRKLPHGVFVVARHQAAQQDALRYLKLGDGPYYTLLRPNIFVHLEVFKTLERVARGDTALLHNSARPRLSVAAVAKCGLKPGDTITRGCGSFELRGMCVRIADRPDHLPIGLADNIRLIRTVEPGQPLTFDDVEIEPTEAIRLWQSIREAAPTTDSLPVVAEA